MIALSEKLREQLPQKPDPDAFRVWRDNGCTQYHLAMIKLMHQEMLESLGLYMSSDIDDESRAFYKFQGGIENSALIIDLIESFYYGDSEDV